MNGKFDYRKLASMTDDEARELLEKIRWADGVYCPKCGYVGAYKITAKPTSKRPVRKGVYKCKACLKQFTVTVGTVFESGHLELGKWVSIIYFVCSCKNGVSALEIQRRFNTSYETAWFCLHRIRYAMGITNPLEKLNGTVEADETYIGGRARGKKGRGANNKSIVVSLVERKGMVRSQKVQNVSAKNLKEIIVKNTRKDSTIMTDDFPSYKGLDKDFKNHYTINHSAHIYVDGNIHTNTIEGFFSLLKRGVNGTYHHISEQHLPLYLNEFDFRYNHRKISDIERTHNAIAGFEGKRLMYRDS